MVYFTCNHCGESLKKNSVDKHYFGKCRRPKFLTCVDCMKDFRDEEYVAHNKCLTENEKYAAKGFSSRPPSMKGETKQLSWVDLINDVCANKKDIPSDQRQLLKILCKHNNVPQKQAKFLNFSKNIAHHISKMTVDLVWGLLNTEKNARSAKETESVSIKSEENGKEDAGTDNNTEEPDQTKKKKKKKPKKHGSSQEVATSGNYVNGDACGTTGESQGGTKKKKRDKHANKEDLAGETETPGPREKHSKKKKKRKNEEEQAVCDGASLSKKKKKLNGEHDKPLPENEEENSTGKFNWCNVIVQVLQSADGQELPVKRLRKKVLSAFSSTGKTVDESVYAKFNKKLSKIPVVLLLKDRAKLKNM